MFIVENLGNTGELKKNLYIIQRGKKHLKYFDDFKNWNHFAYSFVHGAFHTLS